MHQSSGFIVDQVIYFGRINAKLLTYPKVKYYQVANREQTFVHADSKYEYLSSTNARLQNGGHLSAVSNVSKYSNILESAPYIYKSDRYVLW